MQLINGSQIRGARGLLNWSQDDLANVSKISRKTIALIENDFPSRTNNLRKIRQTLTDHGIEFLQDQGVKIRSKEFHDFTGPESCDDFFDYMAKILKERGGDLICMVSEKDMLTKPSCSSGQTNIQRLEEIRKYTNVKCLVDENIDPNFAAPTFDVRILPEEPTRIPITVFAFGNQWVAGFLDDDKRHFTYVIFNKASLMHSCQNYFLPRWHIAKPLSVQPKPKKPR